MLQVRNIFWSRFLCLLVVCQSACSVAPHQPTLISDKDLYDGRYHKAIEKTLADEQKYGETNRLLWLFNLCTLYHYENAYDASNRYCQRAENLSSIVSVESITENISATFTNDNVISYSGTNYERALLYPFGMINYIGNDNASESLVDARKLDVFSQITDSKQEEAFARFISALIYESEGESDSALIDYRKSFDIYSQLNEYRNSETLAEVGRDFFYNLKSSGMDNEYRRYQTRYDFRKISGSLQSGFGEVVFIFEAGFAPYKVTEYIRIPESGDTAAIGMFKNRPPLVDHVRAKAIDAEKATQSFKVYDASFSTSLHQMAHLQDAFGKEEIEPLLSYEFEKYGSSYFDIDPISNLEKADVRSWYSLPGKIHMLRMSLPIGKHDIALKYYSSYGEEVFRQLKNTVVVKNEKRTFVRVKLP